MDDLISRLKSEPEKNQLPLIRDIAAQGDIGLTALMEFLLERKPNPAQPLDGKIYQILLTAELPSTQTFLQTHFPQGVVPLNSERGIDYQPLQQLLAKQDFEAADRLTIDKLCALAGSAAIQRKWLYFTEVNQFPKADLQTVNQLWLVHSEGKFGFSVQREIWLSLGRNWDKLWPQIGWRKDNNWTRYPQEFTWDLTAPRGHLPLSNQLRGVRVINAIFNHPLWTE